MEATLFPYFTFIWLSIFKYPIIVLWDGSSMTPTKIYNLDWIFYCYLDVLRITQIYEGQITPFVTFERWASNRWNAVRTWIVHTILRNNCISLPIFSYERCLTPSSPNLHEAKITTYLHKSILVVATSSSSLYFCLIASMTPGSIAPNSL